MSEVLVGSIALPDGTLIRGRGRRKPVPPGPLPQFGLYPGTPRRWIPDWDAEWIDWPDLRAPRDDEHAAGAITRVFELARAGRRVEIACGGGAGRTGTVIACLAVLAGCPAEDSVAWTRRNYLRRAVETRGQRRWIAWFAARSTN